MSKFRSRRFEAAGVARAHADHMSPARTSKGVASESISEISDTIRRTDASEKRNVMVLKRKELSVSVGGGGGRAALER